MDGYWSRHLDEYLEDQLRSGAEQISLHMEGVSYLSSLGIRVLVKYTKQFKQINGTFGLECLSEPVQSVLDMVGADRSSPRQSHPRLPVRHRMTFLKRMEFTTICGT
jgi:anti-anti-sigma factor